MEKEFEIKHRYAHKRAMIRTEDGLSYNVFNRLTYLKKETLSYLFNKAFNLETENIGLGTIEEFSFWPKWNSKKINKINNANYIEPDIFIRLATVDIIIEAKRYDLGQQYEGQWKDQILAYMHHYNNDDKRLIYIPLGGMNYSKMTHPDALIKQTYWFNIAQACFNTLSNENLEINEYRILADIIEILRFYNHIPLKFLGSLEPLNLSNNQFNL